MPSASPVSAAEDALPYADDGLHMASVLPHGVPSPVSPEPPAHIVLPLAALMARKAEQNGQLREIGLGPTATVPDESQAEEETAESADNAEPQAEEGWPLSSPAAASSSAGAFRALNLSALVSALLPDPLPFSSAAQRSRCLPGQAEHANRSAWDDEAQAVMSSPQSFSDSLRRSSGQRSITGSPAVAVGDSSGATRELLSPSHPELQSSVPLPASSPPPEPKAQRNPIIEMKENVLKHLEEKKKEKEKEKKREGHDDTAAASAVGASATAVDVGAFATVSPTSSPQVPPPPSAPAAAAPSSGSEDSAGVIFPSTPPSSTSGRFNYAAYDSGAKLLASSSAMKKASSVLVSDDDRYMMVACEEAEKWLIVQLKEDILLETVELANYEHYASSIRDFTLYGSSVYPVEQWTLLGHFHAPLSHHAHFFTLPTRDHAVRYLKLIWETQWKEEYYCTLTHLRVYGRSVLEAFREDLDDSAEVLREVEQFVLSNNVKDGEDKKQQEDNVAELTLLDPEPLAHGAAAGAPVSSAEPKAPSSEVGSADAAPSLWETLAAWSGDAIAPVIAQSSVPSIEETADVPPLPADPSNLSTEAPASHPSFPQPLSTLEEGSASALDAQVHETHAADQADEDSSAFAPGTEDVAVEASASTPEQSPTTRASRALDAVSESTAAEISSTTEEQRAVRADRGSDPIVLPPLPPQPAAPSPTSPLLSARDLIYSQMARLGAQAGAQSRAEAEAAASQIDPSYAARFARFSQATTTPGTTLVAGTTDPTHSPLPAGTSPVLIDPDKPETGDGVVRVHVSDAESAAAKSLEDAGRSRSPGTAAGSSGAVSTTSSTSIFKTLTNRLKELEIHQALSTHFVSNINNRFTDDIQQLRQALTLLADKLDAAHQAEADRASVEPAQRAPQELKELESSVRAAVLEQVRAEMRAEVQAVMEAQRLLELRMLDGLHASAAVHQLLQQELLALVALLALWKVVSIVAPSVAFGSVLRGLWWASKGVTLLLLGLVYRLVVLLMRLVLSSRAASPALPPAKVHRRASSADPTGSRPLASASSTSVLSTQPTLRVPAKATTNGHRTNGRRKTFAHTTVIAPINASDSASPALPAPASPQGLSSTAPHLRRLEVPVQASPPAYSSGHRRHSTPPQLAAVTVTEASTSAAKDGAGKAAGTPTNLSPSSPRPPSHRARSWSGQSSILSARAGSPAASHDESKEVGSSSPLPKTPPPPAVRGPLLVAPPPPLRPPALPARPPGAGASWRGKERSRVLEHPIAFSSLLHRLDHASPNAFSVLQSPDAVKARPVK